MLVLVFKDVDLDLGTDIVCALKFGKAGHICVTPSHVFIEYSVKREVQAKVVGPARAEYYAAQPIADFHQLRYLAFPQNL